MPKLTRMKYPAVGSRWTIRIGPEIPNIVVRIVSSGHGSVVVEQVDGTYCVAIDVVAWYRRYCPCAAD